MVLELLNFKLKKITMIKGNKFDVPIELLPSLPEAISAKNISISASKINIKKDSMPFSKLR
jgi:hypothetical protein